MRVQQYRSVVITGFQNVADVLRALECLQAQAARLSDTRRLLLCDRGKPCARDEVNLMITHP